MKLFILLIVAIFVLASAIDVILPPDSSKTGPEGFIIFMQGADIEASTYVPLLKMLQQKVPLKLWVGVPDLFKNMVNPLDMNRGIEKIRQKMVDQGMQSTYSLYGGHSLGGAMIQMWANEHASEVDGQILLGSFLTRTWKNKYAFNYTIPTLTIGGELDGLARVTRMAEAYYTQMMDPWSPADGAKDFPVTVLKGVSHMQFSSGTPPEAVFNRDLIPEVSNERAHSMIADDMSYFIMSRVAADATSANKMKLRLLETKTFVQPIIDALHYEGYHNFRPPCLCETDICEPSDTCTNACPFTNEVSQASMGAGLPGLTIKNIDSFHDVWETEPTVHLPVIQNSCTTSEGCTLTTQTITQGVYHSGEDFEIWKKHFDLPFADSGSFPITAVELRTKMSSRQNIYAHAGVVEPNFHELDETHERCGEINQKSISWATAKVGADTLTRFNAHGQPYFVTPGSDKDVCPAGPCWIWQELKYNTTADGNQVELISPNFMTATDFWLPKTRGFHYCKLLSPARAVEWMYVDGLRAKYSLASQAAAKK
jgi:hypothetical protein